MSDRNPFIWPIVAVCIVLMMAILVWSSRSWIPLYGAACAWFGAAFSDYLRRRK